MTQAHVKEGGAASRQYDLVKGKWGPRGRKDAKSE